MIIIYITAIFRVSKLNINRITTKRGKSYEKCCNFSLFFSLEVPTRPNFLSEKYQVYKFIGDGSFCRSNKRETCNVFSRTYTDDEPRERNSEDFYPS